MAEGRAPSFQFYPADWLNDVKLQTCGLCAHGVLIDLMCLMHQSTEYGLLLINGRQPDTKTIQKLLRISSKSEQKRFQIAIQELLENGVLRKDERGVLFCKRMVEDQRIREIRKAAGKLGGNPSLVNQKVNQVPNQKPTPSSSSSSSSSPSEKEKRAASLFVLPDWVPKEPWDGFAELRRRKGPFTDRAKVLSIKKLEKLVQEGNDATEVLNQSVERGWTGLFPVKDKLPNDKKHAGKEHANSRPAPSPYEKCPHCGEEYERGDTITVNGVKRCPKCPETRDLARENIKKLIAHTAGIKGMPSVSP